MFNRTVVTHGLPSAEASQVVYAPSLILGNAPHSDQKLSTSTKNLDVSENTTVV